MRFWISGWIGLDWTKWIEAVRGGLDRWTLVRAGEVFPLGTRAHRPLSPDHCRVAGIVGDRSISVLLRYAVL